MRNLSRHRIAVRLQAADIRNAANGNADYATSGRTGAGRWVHLAARTVRLAPRAARRIAFSISVPAGTRGAAHYAGIVGVDAADIAAAARPNRRKGTSFSFSRINRQALPITVRLRGPLKRSLALRTVKLAVEPAGAGLVLDLLPGGTVLIQSTPVKLRVSRAKRTILRHASTLGQLFPHDSLDFRIPWSGVPTEGSYRVKGVIRPKAAKPIYIDRLIQFTPARVKELKREVPPVATAPGTHTTSTPMWIWVALTGGAGVLLSMALVIRKLRRRPLAVV